YTEPVVDDHSLVKSRRVRRDARCNEEAHVPTHEYRPWIRARDDLQGRHTSRVAAAGDETQSRIQCIGDRDCPRRRTDRRWVAEIEDTQGELYGVAILVRSRMTFDLLLCRQIRLANLRTC